MFLRVPQSIPQGVFWRKPIRAIFCAILFLFRSILENRFSFILDAPSTYDE